MAKPAFFLRKAYRCVGIFTVWLLLALGLHAQQFTYKLTSVPDSAEVLLNGVSIGKTPMEAKIDWSKLPNGGFVFLFTRPGYADGEYVVAEKPKFKENFKEMKLEKNRPHFDLDSNSVLVNFDKLMTEFPLGKIVGLNKTFYGGDITWEGYSRVGVNQFVTRADDVLGSAGFRTPFIQKNELFSDQNRNSGTPRFLIGGKVTDIWVELGPTTVIGIKAKNWCTIEWKVFDKVLDQVVLTDVSKGEFDGKYTNPTELNVMMDLFQDALENFLQQGTLYTLVKNAGAAAPAGNGDPMVSASTAKLSPVAPLKFESMPELIQYATQACVTVTSEGHLASGVMISETGWMITTAQITTFASPMTVVLSNGVELEAKVVATDADADLALLQVKGSKFKALPLGKGLPIRLGEEIVTVGTPKSLDLGQSVGKGIVSGKRQEGALTLIQTDMPVSAGNSGGPIFNKEGRVIGIIYGKAFAKGADGTAVAVPIETALKRLGLAAGE
jgi:S1-C subfamily serine protease